jgi:hypothetical protein
MSAWSWLVAGPCAAVAAAAALVRRRQRRRNATEVVAAADLGLEQFPPRGAFLQFSTPNAPSRVSLNRLAEAAAHHPLEVTVVELPAYGSCASRLGVRSAPTVLHLDAGGVVRHRWTRPPERAELAALLGEAPPAPVATQLS